MKNDLDIERFDNWFDDDGPAAVVVVENLQPVTGEKTVIFPPTYAPEQSSSDRKSEYVIDTLRDGSKVCQIDSVGSQANRMEPIFKMPIYDKLVPQVSVEVATGKKINLLDAGHRAADAIMRFSDLNNDITNAFENWLRGDASDLAKIAPTSILFGVWDSRGTQAKVPRILSSIIRAYDVEQITRSAQYIPPLDYTQDILGDAASLTDDQKSEFGLTHVPAPRALGGVIVHGELRREAILNIVALRTLGVPDGNGRLDKNETIKIRRYILGLGLVALTKPMSYNLRQGCLLVAIKDKPANWELVYPDGKRDSFKLLHEEALAYAQKAVSAIAAKAPSVGRFDPKLVKAAADEKTKKKEAKKGNKKAAGQDSKNRQEG